MPQQFVSLLLSILFLLKCAADYTGEQFTVALELDYFGTIVITTVPADAFPLATKTFLGNVRRRMYEGCVFYRLETFVLQGGECTFWDETDRPPHILHNYGGNSPVTPVSPPEWNNDFPHIIGSVALAGSPASMHFFINLIDRKDWSNRFKDGVQSEPTVGHVVKGMDVIQAIRSTSKVTATHKVHGLVNGMNFLVKPIRIRRAFIIEDEMNQATKTFLVTLSTGAGNIFMRTIPSNRKSVKMFIHNCQHYYASPSGSCNFYRAEVGKLLMAGECVQPHVPVTSEKFAPEFDEDWQNIAGAVTLTGEKVTSEFFFINSGNNSDWIRRGVVAHVEKGWTTVLGMLGMRTQRTHPVSNMDLKMSFLSEPIPILSCNAKPLISDSHPLLHYLNNQVSEPLEYTSKIPSMIYRRLGATELQVSIIGLGAHNFGDLGKVGSVDHLVALLKNAIFLGINFIDTADAYPCFASTGQCVGKKSEILIGQAIKKLSMEDPTFERDALVIMTKIYDDRTGLANSRGLSRKHIIRGCFQALERLQLNYLDIFVAHADDPSIKMESIVRSFASLIDSGKILHWGVSNWSLERIKLAYQTAKKIGLPAPMVDQTSALVVDYNERKKLLNELDIGIVLFGARHLPGYPEKTPNEIRLTAASKVDQLIDTVKITISALQGEH